MNPVVKARRRFGGNAATLIAVCITTAIRKQPHDVDDQGAVGERRPEALSRPEPHQIAGARAERARRYKPTKAVPFRLTVSFRALGAVARMDCQGNPDAPPRSAATNQRQISHEGRKVGRVWGFLRTRTPLRSSALPVSPSLVGPISGRSFRAERGSRRPRPASSSRRRRWSCSSRGSSRSCPPAPGGTRARSRGPARWRRPCPRAQS